MLLCSHSYVSPIITQKLFLSLRAFLLKKETSCSSCQYHQKQKEQKQNKTKQNKKKEKKKRNRKKGKRKKEVSRESPDFKNEITYSQEKRQPTY